MITIIKLRDLFADLSKKGMAQVFSDWEMLVGIQAKSNAEAIQLAGGIDEIDSVVETPHTVVQTQVQKGEQGMGPIYFAFPNALVIEIIAEVLMIPDTAKEARASQQLSENDVDTFREMANLLCGSWNRVFQDLERDLRISQSVDDLKVWPGEPGESALSACVDPGRVAYVPLEVEANGKTFSSLFTIPFDVAIGVAQEFYEG